MNIAVIGLGAMGWPMAGHLKNAGHDLLLYTRSPEKVASLSERGAVTQSIAECCNADCVVINVTGTADVIEVTTALALDLQPGTLVIDHSTIDPAGARVAAGLIRDAGGQFVDAPVSGGEVAAIEGRLVGMVGGDADAVASAEAVFNAYIKSYVHMGPVGSGQVTKLCNQIAQVINIQGICEAMHFADQHQVDKAKVLEAISPGMAGSAMLNLMGPKIASGDFAAGIQSRLHAKDLNIAADTMTTPALAATVAQLNTLMEQGLGQSDTSALFTLLGQSDGQ